MATMTQPAPGIRLKKTTFTEVVPTEDRSPSDAQPSPFYAREWETVMSALTPDQWQGHVVRVYRADEKWDRSSSPVDNTFTAAFTEDDMRARFGGGKYLLWLYGPPKRQNLVGRYQVNLDGPPLLNGVPRNGGMPDGSNAVAMQALQMMNNPQIMQMQLEMMRSATLSAIDIIKGQMPVAQNPLETLRTAKEILGVGNSSEHGLLDTIRVLKELGIIGSPEKKGIDEILSLITTLKTSGLITSGVPKADLASTFASNLPMLADRLVAGLQEFRMRAEAEERVIRLQRGEIKPGDPNVITQTPAPQSATTPNGASSSPAQDGTQVTPEVAQAIIAQAHLHRLVAGIKQPDSNGQDMYDYLVNAWPEILGELSKMSKETLLSFFKSRELQRQYFGTDILAEVGDDPRLPKMIEEFLAIAKQNAQDVSAAEKVATTSVV